MLQGALSTHLRDGRTLPGRGWWSRAHICWYRGAREGVSSDKPVYAVVSTGSEVELHMVQVVSPCPHATALPPL
jgi:hypothetical protein